MKKLLFILILLTACSKEPIDERKVQLSVEGNGTYLITYGISNCVTIKGEDKWTAIMTAYPGDSIHLSVRTAETPASIYLGVEVREGLIFCKSLYVDPRSVGTLNYLLEP
jgi:hypothetical protein